MALTIWYLKPCGFHVEAVSSYTTPSLIVVSQCREALHTRSGHCPSSVAPSAGCNSSAVVILTHINYGKLLSLQELLPRVAALNIGFSPQ